jgi:hypothetical protein
MNVLEIVKHLESDGVRLVLSDSGSIKAIGDGTAVNRWLPTIRERKSEIIAVLQQTENETAGKPIPVLSRDGEAAILAWLSAIGETDPVTIGEVIDSCRSDAGARAYFIERAVVELPKSKG